MGCLGIFLLDSAFPLFSLFHFLYSFFYFHLAILSLVPFLLGISLGMQCILFDLVPYLSYLCRLASHRLHKLRCGTLNTKPISTKLIQLIRRLDTNGRMNTTNISSLFQSPQDHYSKKVVELISPD